LEASSTAQLIAMPMDLGFPVLGIALNIMVRSSKPKS
jgi:hypothetical protein